MAKRASRSPVERTSAAIPSRTPASPLQSQGGRRPVASVAAVMPPAPADGPQGAESRTRSRDQSEPKRNRWRHREGRGRDLEAGLLLPVRCRPGSHQGPGRGRSRDPDPLELRCERSPSGRRAGVRQGLQRHPEDLQPAPHPPAHEAYQSAQGPGRGPRVRAGRLGRGARRDRDPHARHPLPGARGRVRIPAACGEFRWRRHAHPVHGDAARLPVRRGPSTRGSGRGRA